MSFNTIPNAVALYRNDAAKVKHGEFVTTKIYTQVY